MCRIKKSSSSQVWMKLRQVEIPWKAAGRTSRILRQAVLGSIPQEKPAARAVPEWGCHSTKVPGVIT